MPADDALERRLRAVERALTDGDHAVADLAEAGALTERIDDLETDLADAVERIEELEAANQALRGYVGNVRSVNRDVERRADAALAAVEDVEARLEAVEERDDGRSARSFDGERSTRHLDDDSADGGDECVDPTTGDRDRRPVDESEPSPPTDRCPTCGAESQEPSERAEQARDGLEGTGRDARDGTPSPGSAEHAAAPGRESGQRAGIGAGVDPATDQFAGSGGSPQTDGGPDTDLRPHSEGAREVETGDTPPTDQSATGDASGRSCAHDRSSDATETVPPTTASDRTVGVPDDASVLSRVRTLLR